DYYYSGSSKAGPVSPKNDGKFWTPYDVTRSVRYYLQLGVPNNKLCLGVPYYGYDWPTTDSLPNSNTSGSGTARIYNDAALTASYNGRLWDRHASVPYYAYTSGTSWRQCWYDDSVSLGFKYDMVNMCNIGGIGIWALGYDRTRQELWNLLREKFSSCGNTLCSGSFTDMGGPEGDYFAGDNYTFTIFQKDLGVISSVFTDFGMTANDSLIAYNGFNTQSAVIGRYTGVFPPKVVTSNSGALTFKFVSASTSTGKGWQAHWNCGNALPPDVLQLMPSRIPENQRQGTLIGRLQVPDSIKIQGGSLAFTGNDNSDQRYFRIHGDSLLSNVVFDYEKQNRYTVSISGSDIEGRAMWNNFDINVLDVNDPPFAINAIKDQTVQLGEPFKISFAGTYFFDEDFGDSLSISLSEDGNSKLPSWLDFDPKALQISGTPSGSEAQTIKLQLVALDRVGAKATLPFNLIIERPVGYVDSMTSEIMTFPNPTSGVITLLVSADFRVSPYVEIYKYNGLKVGQIRLTLDGLSRQKATVDLSSFPNGLYFLRLRAGNKVYINKVSLMKPR
ncbi:MAG TPA: glycosyl hydrolase family 18 protein, partial [Bacteroidales bacterium]